MSFLFHDSGAVIFAQQAGCWKLLSALQYLNTENRLNVMNVIIVKGFVQWRHGQKKTIVQTAVIAAMFVLLRELPLIKINNLIIREKRETDVSCGQEIR